MELRKATRKKAKLRIGLAGPSGSGKTYSALLMASGMAPWAKIAVIDTENGSGELYTQLGEYNVITLTAPFTPERYIEAIKACEDAGMEVIIIDSVTHEWDGEGGCLDIHSKMPGNSFANWAKITPRHNKFIQKILQSPCHILTTVRKKQDYDMSENNGKVKVTKVGLKEVQREGFEYELTVNFEIDIAHNASAGKDRTGLFMDKPDFVVTSETGKTLLAWANEGIEPPRKVNDLEVHKIFDLFLKVIKNEDPKAYTPVIQATLKKDFGITKITELTNEQANILIIKLQGLAEKQKQNSGAETDRKEVQPQPVQDALDVFQGAEVVDTKKGEEN